MDQPLFLLLLGFLLVQMAQLLYLRAIHLGFLEDDDEEAPDLDGPPPHILDEALAAAQRGPILPELGDNEEELDIR